MHIAYKKQYNKGKLAILGGKPILKNQFPPYNSLGKEEKDAVIKVMDGGVLSDFLGRAGDKFLGGEFVRRFEDMVCEYFNVKYAVSFNSASTALQASIAALGIGPGDEVITSPFTMSSTASAMLLNNAIPVFADLDSETYSLDPRSIEERITKRTKAVLLVNIFGGSSDFARIMPLARKYNLKIIEDNAQAIGAKYKNRFLGTIGDIGIFSFNVHKHLQSGEGGVLVTNNKRSAFRAQLVRNHGETVVDDLRKERIYEPIVGNNYRLSELHAAIAIEQLKKINKLISPQVKLANYLTPKINRFPWLEALHVLKDSTHAYYLYPFKFFSPKIGIKRSTFAKAMTLEGFHVAEGYCKPLYLAPLYQKKRMYPHSQFPFISKEYKSKVNYSKGICPVAEHLYEKELLTTTVFQLAKTKKDIDLFIQAIAKIDRQIEDLAAYEKRK